METAVSGVEHTVRLFEKGPVVLFEWRNAPEWPVQFVSQNVKHLLGHKPEDFTSGKIAYGSLIHKSDLRRVSDEVSNHTEHRHEIFEHEPYRLKRTDGSYIWVLDHTRILYDSKDSVLGYFGYLIDITEHQDAMISLRQMKEDLEKYVERRTHDLKQANAQLEIEIHNHSLAEKALQSSIQRFESIINQTASMAIQGFDRGGYITFWNRTSEKLYKISEADALGNRIQDILPDYINRKTFPDTLSAIEETRKPSDARYFEVPIDSHHNATVFSVIYPVQEEGEIDEFFRMDIDITDQTRYQNELQKANIFLDNIMNTIADPIFVKDSNHRWILLNDAFCKFMGYERHQLIGKSDYDFFPKDEADVFWKADNEVFKTAKPNVNEEDFTDASGQIHVISTKKMVFTDKVTGKKVLVGIIRDVTEFKRLEKELEDRQDDLQRLIEDKTTDLQQKNAELRKEIEDRKSSENQLIEERAKLVSILENALVGVIMTDSDGNYIYMNKRAATLFGYTFDELKSRRLIDLTYKDDKEKSKKFHEDVLTGKSKGYHLEKRYVRKDGTVFWGEVNVTVVHSQQGEITTILKLIRDIDTHKMTELTILEHDLFLSNLLDSIPNPVFYHDMDRVFMGCNTAFEELVGIARKKLIGKKPDELDLAKKTDIFPRKETVTTRKPSTTCEAKFIDQNDIKHHMILCKSLFTNHANKPIGVVGTMLDITKRKEAEDKLQRSYCELQEAQKSIRELERRTTALAMAATANHEINQPLMVIRGNLDLIRMNMNSHEDQTPETGKLCSEMEPYLLKIEASMDAITGILEKYRDSNDFHFDNYDDESDMIVFEDNKKD